MLTLESAFRLLLIISAKNNNLEALMVMGCEKLALSGFYMPVKSTNMFIYIIQTLRMMYGKHKATEAKEVKEVVFRIVQDNIACVELCCEGFLLLSILINEKSEEDKVAVSEIIKLLMNEYKDNEREMHKIAQAASHLPIEDLPVEKFK